MEERSLLARIADVVARAALVVFGLICTPIPSGFWFILVDETAPGAYAYAYDDGPWFSSLIIFLIVMTVYAAFIVPAIWRKRFFAGQQRQVADVG